MSSDIRLPNKIPRVVFVIKTKEILNALVFKEKIWVI